MTVYQVIEAMKEAGLRGLGGAGFPVGPEMDASSRAEAGPRLWRHQWRRGRARNLQGPAVSQAQATPDDGRHPDCRACCRCRRLSISTCATNIGPSLRCCDAEIALVGEGRVWRKVQLHLRRGAGAYICGEESAMIDPSRASAACRDTAPLRGPGAFLTGRHW